MKKCFKCGIEKELSEFYVHPQMGDGHLNKCKICTKKDSLGYEKENRKNPVWCEKERQRSKEKYHRLNYRKKQFEQNKLKPYKQGIYKILHKKYNLSKDENIHHWNYNKPLDFIIINKKLHRFIHKFITLDENLLVFRTIEGTLLNTKEDHIIYIETLGKLF
jgi:hypothetical protein